jgi:acyl-CoA reductase-like NAD-dependent aldehyde dehydrogenase
MPERLEITKTYKLYIDGKFPRSESGRSTVVRDAEWEVIAHVCHASRKDLRDAVKAAKGALGGWSSRDAYNRGQILYRMGEMLESKRPEFEDALMRTMGLTKREAHDEVGESVDRLIAYAGWTDKYPQVLGCANPVNGPYYNFTVPGPTGVVACVSPDAPSLLGLVSVIAPALAGGNTVVALSSEDEPITASVLGEVCATSDVPPGVVNLLTGMRGELLSWVAEHREINAVHAAGLNAEERKTLELGCAENVKRVTVRDGETDFFDDASCTSPWWIEPFVEMKTIWHPSSSG